MTVRRNQGDVGSHHQSPPTLQRSPWSAHYSGSLQGVFLYNHFILNVRVFPITGEGTSLSTFKSIIAHFDLHWSFFYTPPRHEEVMVDLTVLLKLAHSYAAHTANCMCLKRFDWWYSHLDSGQRDSGPCLTSCIQVLIFTFPHRGLFFAVLFYFQDLHWMQRRVLFWNNWQSVLLHVVFGRCRDTFSVK